MLEDPSLCIRPEIQTLMDFVDAVPSNAATFPIKTRTSSIIHENTDDVLLSKKITQKVESGCVLKRDGGDHDSALQVTDTSTKFRKLALNSSEYAQKQVALQAFDKKVFFIEMTIASQ